MVNALDVRHSFGWLAPSPMWGAFGDLAGAAERQRFARPAILRFATDSFMEEFMATLALQPEKLAEWQARWETWEQPMASPPVAPIERNEPLSRRAIQQVRAPALLKRKTHPDALAVSPAPAPQPERPLKLYQPVQNRFYLVSASLVCRRRPGLPDRHVNHGKQEQVGYVLRRRIAPATGAGSDPLTWDEYAYVQTMHGPSWQIIDDKGSAKDTLQPGEERLPMFSLGYTDVGSNSRRIYAGVIPVGRREAYIGAPVQATPASSAADSVNTTAPDLGPDTRLLQFALQVTGPWRELINAAQAQRARYENWPAGSGDTGDSTTQKNTEIIAGRERMQTNSWYVLLDFVRFLNTHLKPVAQVLVEPALRSSLTPAEEALYAFLELPILNTTYKNILAIMLNALPDASYQSSDILTKLIHALAAVASDTALQQDLEDAESIFTYAKTTSGWPGFLFPLADAALAYGPCPLSVSGVNLYGGSVLENIALQDIPPSIDTFFETLMDKIEAALPGRDQTPQPEINIQADMPQADTEAWFTIHCVYESPNCGALTPPLLSSPTEAFQMASFFDPEAPARAVRIPLPFNITPAALRRYNKSATFVVSDMLCGQLKRIRKLSLGDLVLSVLPWPFHKDLPNVGPGGSCRDGSSNVFGMLCSLSIPIVTLCALILLLIIVALFDVFFRWIPLLFLCFPIPKLGGKR